MNDFDIADPEKKMTYEIENVRVKEDHAILYLPEEKLMVSPESYYKYRLTDAKQISEDLHDLLKEEDRLLRAYRGCLRKISVKDHTVRQIREYLALKDLKKPEQDDILKKLLSYQLLDDEKYCISRIAVLQKTNMSCRQIRNKLENDGISEDLISRYLKADPDEEYAKCLNAAKKHASSIRNRSIRAMKQNIVNRLVVNGFSYDMSIRAANELDYDQKSETEALKKEYGKISRKLEKKYEGKELKNRICVTLLNKGFNMTQIKEMMEE